MTEILGERPFGLQYTNVYLSIFILFCFKLFVKITLNILTHFYVVKGNRKEAARIAEEFYDFGQGHSSWADRSPLHEAACQGRLLALKTLLSQGYNANIITIDHVTPLHEACLGDHVACSRALIEAGANVNATTIDAGDPTVQRLLSRKCHLHWSRAACVEALISWGADVDYDIPHLGTPLYIACISRELQCTQTLLDGGANVQKGRFLDTPLHAAAQKDCPEIIRVLLDFGANINARNVELKRPVETAPPSSTAESMLLLYEATPRSLCQLCRLSIRNYMGQSRMHLIPHLKLPNLLKSFLQYR
ncbi:Ankyrin repeat and SOCS box protein 5 [Triplophysa tibetana]|uniref:Ankyrin repeat and SOCS box protein 5 n=1 Tax=Triplophysa tibetana TaxID=1572043 RepID=A0A5A9PK58_9TELE|nr:Ankyrin repeat and SOCS box protein 5 [Triplophysa tibetana]